MAYSFADDYSEGVHPRILETLVRTNWRQQLPYGNDEYCTEAKHLIRQKIGIHDASIFFVTGGTAANLACIGSCLKPHEAIIAATSAHIVTREAGAIESTGHKIITVASADGKLLPDDIRDAVTQNQVFAHQAKCRLVYIANASEIGTVYTLSELAAISEACKDLSLLLFLDGARLGTALMSTENDMSLQDIYTLTDLFWIGGTKTGALLGEAIIIKDQALAAEFPYHMKQRGQLLAKGRILGIQFTELFRDDLFFRLAQHANLMASEISTCLTNLGIELRTETRTNQVFPILPAPLVERLQKDFGFHICEHRPDGSTVLRIVTSWATEKLHVDKFNTCVREWIQDMGGSEG